MKDTIPKTSIRGLILQVLTWRQGVAHKSVEVTYCCQQLMGQVGKTTNFGEVFQALQKLKRSGHVVFSFREDPLEGRWSVTKTGQAAAAVWIAPEQTLRQELRAHAQ